jgi:hypothetical protein
MYVCLPKSIDGASLTFACLLSRYDDGKTGTLMKDEFMQLAAVSAQHDSKHISEIHLRQRPNFVFIFTRKIARCQEARALHMSLEQAELRGDSFYPWLACVRDLTQMPADG